MSENSKEKVVSDASSESSAPMKVEPASPGPRPPSTRELGFATLSILLYLLLIDTAVETFLSGAPVRWIIAGTVAGYGALSVLLWRRAGWAVKATVSLLVLLGLLAATAWRPEGLSHGMTLLRQPTSTVLAVISALAVMLSGSILVRLKFVPIPARAAIGVLTAYGLAAFALGIAGGTPYPDLFHGRSVWERLPYWVQGAFVGGIFMVFAALLTLVATAGVHIRRPRLRWWGVQFLSLSMTLVMAVAGFKAPAGSASVPISPSHALELKKTLQALAAPQSLLALFDSLESLQNSGSYQSFDTDMKAAELGSNVDKIFGFVRDQVRYEAYEGVLRGPRGTLMAMAGNSFDKSLLLGALLSKQGIQVRYVRGRLSEGRAKVLVSQMFAVAKQELPSIRGSVERIPPSLATASSQFAQTLTDRWLSNVEIVRTALRRGNILATAPPVTKDILIDEAMDHLWVEYMLDNRWVALDPSFRGALPGEGFADPGDVWAIIPEEVVHRIAIRLVVEERNHESISSRTALTYKATAADLNGSPVTLWYEVTPSNTGWSATPVLQVEDSRVDGEAFGTNIAGSSPRIETSLLGGADQPRGQSEGDIVALWLETDFTYPSGRTETVRREIFDRIGPSARLEKREATAVLAHLPVVNGIPLPLTAVFALSFSSGSLNPGLLLGRILRQAPALREVVPLVAALKATGRSPTREEAGRLAGTLHHVLPDLLGLLAASYHVRSQSNLILLRQVREWRETLPYVATPRLTIASFELATDDKDKSVSGHLALDLRRNVLPIVALEAPGVQLVWANTVRGVLDGVLEHMLLDSMVPAAPDTSPFAAGIVTVMEQARREGTSVATITEREGISRVDAPQQSKARLFASLSDGSVAIVPLRAALIGGRQRLAWWQVDPATGETLGVMDTGLHQGIVEYRAPKDPILFNPNFLFAFYIWNFIVIPIIFVIIFSYFTSPDFQDCSYSPRCPNPSRPP